ncbi:MAG TPA: replication initiation protein [Bacteroidales bacterium]|nr:replication initiation protein [Bacteroidales bacterium]
MKANNKQMIQSYIVTTARYDFSVYEKRIIYRLVELCQCALEGQKLIPGFQINPLLYEEMKEIVMPISAFLKDEKDENYSLAKKALWDLKNKVIEYEDDEIWKPISIIEMPKLIKKGYVKFVLHKEIYEALLDFSKGFRKYELAVVFKFDSVYAMRFYELLSGKTDPITYSIDNLKIMFKLENKYKLNTDFIRYVINTAKKELDEKAPISFEYKLQKNGKKIVAITFYPYEIPQNKDETLERKALMKQTALSWDLDKMVINYLKENYLFDTDEIKNNRELFIEASRKLDIMNILANKRRYCESRTNPKGTLITILKRELAKQTERG